MFLARDSKQIRTIILQKLINKEKKKIVDCFRVFRSLTFCKCLHSGKEQKPGSLLSSWAKKKGA